MSISNELQIGKAGEYIVCADIIIKGLVCYPSEQGLPYDVVIDNGSRLLKCQVKTTTAPRKIPQRSKDSYAYIFNVKRHGKAGLKRYNENDVDLFALVELETRTVAYIKNKEMPDTLNLRVDRLRGTYYDEKGIADYVKANELAKEIKSQTKIAEVMGSHVSCVNRWLKKDFTPHQTKAPYFSDYNRTKEFFYEL